MQIMDLFSLFGGLGLFLFGIKAMGEGLEQAAGHRMKSLLHVLTKNRLTAVLVGVLITAVIQSSSATTVMVVGFVNAGILQLSNAIGIIMGANIGTTVTSLMLSVKLDFGVIFAAIGGICMLLGNRSTFKLIGQIMMGLGVLFVGMNTMSTGMQPLQSWEGFRQMMQAATNPVVGVLVGAAVTALIQSSSASVGILQALASTGAISLQASLFILFGQNIGTCVTALLASVGANRTARRTAIVHLLFNVIGAVLFLVITIALPLDRWIISIAGDNLRLQIAFAHIIFNVTTTLLLLPAAKLLEQLSYMVVPGEDKQTEPMRLQFFDDRLFSTPPIAAQQLFAEVGRMADLVQENYTLSLRYFHDPKNTDMEEFVHREEVIDFLNAEITQRLIELRGLSLSEKDRFLTGSLFHVVNDLERMGDHAVNIYGIGRARKKGKITFSGKAESELAELTELVSSMLEKAIYIVKVQSVDPEVVGEVIAMESKADELSELFADHHVQRVKEKKCTPRNGMLYLDMLNNLERIADHADNLATSVDITDTEKKSLLW